MSASAHLQRVLWPDLDHATVWAVLDAARSPEVYARLGASPRAPRCLLAGDLSPALARAAPYLVSLSKDEPWTTALLDAAWGNAWGVFLRARAMGLHRHLAGALRLLRPPGDRGLFRYYDPRVLRVCMELDDAAVNAGLFGAVRAWVVEGVSPDEVLEFSLVGGSVKLSRSVADHKLRWLGDYLRRE